MLRDFLDVFTAEPSAPPAYEVIWSDIHGLCSCRCPLSGPVTGCCRDERLTARKLRIRRSFPTRGLGVWRFPPLFRKLFLEFYLLPVALFRSCEHVVRCCRFYGSGIFAASFSWARRCSDRTYCFYFHELLEFDLGLVSNGFKASLFLAHSLCLQNSHRARHRFAFIGDRCTSPSSSYHVFAHF